MMNGHTVAHGGQWRWGGEDQREAELGSCLDQTALVPRIQCQGFVQIANALDRAPLVLHQVQHRQARHQLGHQHRPVRCSAVEVIEGFRLATSLAHPKAQTEQVGHAQTVAGVAFFDEQGFGAVELVVIQHALLIEELEGLAIANRGRRADEQLDGLDERGFVFGFDLEDRQIGELAPADLAIELAHPALERGQAIAQFAQASRDVHHRRPHLLFQSLGFLRQVMGELHQARYFCLGLTDELVLGKPARVDFAQHSADLVVQLQQLAAVGLIGLQALGELIQLKLRLCQPGVIGEVGQPEERPFVIDALVAALLNLPVLLPE